ncbi:MAG: SRPBCC family protein [Planctomycetes bacterium]|nr:SRPBCC family protein [Planctomycetota bacterium]
MKLVKTIAVVLVALAVLFVGIGLFLPRDWNVERSILIRASPDQIHPWVERPSKWNDWFAWEEMKTDPSYKVWTSGPETGVGATYQWSGNTSGNGKIVITGSDPQGGVHLDECIESNETNAKGVIAYTPADGGMTRVTWTDSGKLPAVIGGYFRGMVDAAIGAAFEKGLANLKSKVEATK